MCPSEKGSASIGRVISACLGVSIAWTMALLGGAKDGGWSLFKCCLSRATSLAKLKINCRKTLHKSKDDRNFVGLVGGIGLRMESVLWDASSKRFRKMKLPNYSVVSKKNLLFSSLSVAPALYNSERSICLYSMPR